jgi:ABC-2 type transport system permease protein
MRSSWRLFWSGVRASWADYLTELTPEIFLGMRLPRILLQSLFFVFMAKAAGGDELERFALIGNGVQIAVFMLMMSMESVIESEKFDDTFQYLIAAPSSWLPIMLGKCMAYYGDAMIASSVTFAVLIPLLHVPIALLDLLRAAPVILIIFASAGALGWCIGAFSLPIRYGYLISNWMGYIMMIFCGINVPFSGLSAPLQFVGNLLPVTNGLLAVRALIGGASYASVWPWIARELLIFLVYGAIAWVVFGYRMRVTRQRGTFDMV